MPPSNSNDTETTFNPQAPGSPGSAPVDSNTSLTALSCPSAAQCTAIDTAGRELTFDPASPGTPPRRAIDRGASLTGLACPTTTLCTAVDTVGRELTFNPNAPGHNSHTVDGNPLVSVACPSTSQCTAVDNQSSATYPFYSSGEVTFNPAAPNHPTRVVIDPGHVAGSITCPSTGDCVASDANGRVLEGNPQGTGVWRITAIAGADSLGVYCPALSECIAGDDVGQVFLGRSSS